MKKLSDFRKEGMLEEATDDDRRLTALVRAGLFDAKKLPLLRRAMDKSAKETTPQERGVLIDLLHHLISVVNSNQAIYTKVKQAVREDITEQTRVKEPPATLLMRRKAIRMFPDGKRVVMYYIDKLKRYISIPYDEFFGMSFKDIPMSEEPITESVLEELKDIVDKGQHKNVVFSDNSTMKIDNLTAKAILNVHDAVNLANKKKIERMINKDKTNFAKVAAFAHGAHTT